MINTLGNAKTWFVKTSNIYVNLTRAVLINSKEISYYMGGSKIVTLLYLVYSFWLLVTQLQIFIVIHYTAVFAGLPGEVETIIHGARKIFEDDETEAIQMIDAKNAFNLMNRNLALNNIR